MTRTGCPDLVVPDAVWHLPWIAHVTAWGEGEQAVLDYLARYVFRIAISNARLTGLDETGVTFRYRPEAAPVLNGINLDVNKAFGGLVQDAEDAALRRLGDVLYVAEPGFVADYVSGGRNVPLRPVTLRQVMPDNDALYRDRAGYVRSEALLRLDFGKGRLPGMLVLGAEDPHQFKPTQGTDLLAFFAGVFERTMRRWLS